MVERLNGIQEVRGSTPLISTTDEKYELWRNRVRIFLFSELLGVAVVSGVYCLVAPAVVCKQNAKKWLRRYLCCSQKNSKRLS